MGAQGLRQDGFSVVEVVIALALVSVVMVAALIGVQRDARALSSLARKTFLELHADSMLDQVGDKLVFAQGVDAVANLSTALGAGDTRASLTDTAAFPDAGFLLFEAGTAFEERAAYNGLDPAAGQLLNLDRGVQCTGNENHPLNAEVRWAGGAVAIENQANPPAWMFDGTSQETAGPVFFRGDGIGFSFRVHTDPAGGTDYFDANGYIQWGATVAGAPTLDGRLCYYFQPVAVVTEAGRAADLNGDGDQLDTFDLGRLRMRAWDAANASPADDVALCPPIILQEQCNWAGDLDGDGFGDPMFLFDPTTGRLRVRLFLLTATPRDTPLVRIIETVIFLRNSIDE